MNSYADCQKVIATARKGARQKPLGNNTRLIQYHDSFAIQLHRTNVVRFYLDGSIVLDTGGWQTVTTKSRMNEYLPLGWYVKKELGVWYLCNITGKGSPEYIFHDRIKIGPRGGCDGKRRKGN